MDCPKCGSAVSAGDSECRNCGVMLAKASDAADRAYLRRQTQARQQQAVVAPPQKSSGARALVIMIILAVCAFGAWHWYNDRTTSDLDRLAAEVKERPANAAGSLDNGRTARWMWIRVGKFGIAVAVFVAGYARLKSSLSP